MITYFSIIMPLIAMIGVSFLIQKSSPLIDKDISIKHKHATLDGMRGFAALFVVVHHSFFTYQHHLNNKWHVYTGMNKEVFRDPYLLNVIVNLGGAAVCLFFMLTGFLFFDKALNSNGRMSIKDFYLKRWLRIAPMYYFSIVIALFVSIYFGVRHVAGFSDAIRSWFGWFAFGLIPYNGFATSFDFGRINAGVIWTLAIEWQFYFLFPFIFSFCDKRKLSILFAVASTVIIYILYFVGLYDEKKSTIYLCFCFGMLSALFAGRLTTILSNNLCYLISSAIALSFLISSIIFPSTIYNPIYILSLFAFFFLVSNGCDLFGLAIIKPLKLIGLISYSIYLMHGIVLNLVINLLPDGVPHFGFIMVSAIVVIPLCFLTYIFIERPFMIKK